jgi:hypothetical protein
MKGFDFVYRVICLLCIISMAGCVGVLPKGTVLDSDSGDPVIDAHVIIQFLGDGIYAWPDPGATARDRCYGTLITKTNSKGEFDFSPLQSSMPTTEDYKRNNKIMLHVYKSGYSMSKRYDFVEKIGKMPRIMITPKYTKVDESNAIVRIDPISPEELEDRYFFTSTILNNLCESYSSSHWELESSILKEMEKLAITERDWRETKNLCERINANNLEYELNREEHDCAQYQDEVIKERRIYKDKLKEVVSGIDWGDGLKLEYLDLFDLESDTNSTIFLTRTPISEIDAKSIFAALKKVCESEFPRNIGEGHVCIILNKVPDDYKENRSELCDVRYLGRIERLRIYVGKEAGTFVDANPGWCR